MQEASAFPVFTPERAQPTAENHRSLPPQRRSPRRLRRRCVTGSESRRPDLESTKNGHRRSRHNFIGQRRLSDRRLRDAIVTRITWWNFSLTTTIYIHVLEYDREQLRQF